MNLENGLRVLVATAAMAAWATAGCGGTTSDGLQCGGLANPCAEADSGRHGLTNHADAGSTAQDAGPTAPARADAGPPLRDAAGSDATHDQPEASTDAGGTSPAGDAGDAGNPLRQVDHCGPTARNCLLELMNVWGPRCVWSGIAENDGTCDYDTCAADYYDIDGSRDNGCEYACSWNPAGTNTRDLGGAYGCGRDDDCNGLVDDGLDLCHDAENCGMCGFTCTLSNTAASSCRTTATDGFCDVTNTHCVVDACAAGFVDANGSPDDGCEYQCTPTNGGVELCNGIDDDCDRLIDNADDSLDDALLGVTCHGGDKGVCAALPGVTKCIDDIPSCCDLDSSNVMTTDPNRYPSTGLRNDVCRGAVAPFVTRPGDMQELCNAVDDDCDGVVDGVTPDSGGLCGSAIGECRMGHYVCVTTLDGTGTPVSASLVCQGGKGPSPEVCDGLDNDCNLLVDDACQ